MSNLPNMFGQPHAGADIARLIAALEERMRYQTGQGAPRPAPSARLIADGNMAPILQGQMPRLDMLGMQLKF